MSMPSSSKVRYLQKGVAVPEEVTSASISAVVHPEPFKMSPSVLHSAISVCKPFQCVFLMRIINPRGHCVEKLQCPP